MKRADRTKIIVWGALALVIVEVAFNAPAGALARCSQRSFAAPVDASLEKLTLWKFSITEPKYGDGCVSLKEDRTLVAFQSRRPGGYGGYDIWLARFENGGWSEPMNAGPGVNSDIHEIDVGLSADGKSMYFTRSAFGGRGAVAAQGNIQNKQTDLYISYFRDGRWSTTELIPPPVSLQESSEFRAVLSRDGRRLYFGSDRKGGYGGYDLYFSERRGDKWREPVNLGPKINTAADELDAAIAPDEKTLILPIQGNLLISFEVNNDWTTPVDMGPRFNTPGSDGCPWLGYDGHTLYVNSSREDILTGLSGQSRVWVFEYQRGFGKDARKQ